MRPYVEEFRKVRALARAVGPNPHRWGLDPHVRKGVLAADLFLAAMVVLALVLTGIQAPLWSLLLLAAPRAPVRVRPAARRLGGFARRRAGRAGAQEARVIRAMWAEVKRTFRPPRTPWEEWWWNDEFLATGQWCGIAAALLLFLGGVAIHVRTGSNAAFILIGAAGPVYVVTLLGVAAYLRTR